MTITADPITRTTPCELGQCHRCKGTVRSYRDGDGPCDHECHAVAADPVAYEHTADDADANGYLPYDGMGQPISRRDFDRIMSTATPNAEPEDLDNSRTVSLDYARSI